MDNGLVETGRGGILREFSHKNRIGYIDHVSTEEGSEDEWWV